MAEGSLLFRWPGSDPGLAPILLMGHLDVVPVEPGTEARWTHPPFSGAVDGAFVWGRGALDDKVSVLGLAEATELLLREGFAPRRTVYLAFGHDEEIGGNHGAAAIARTLGERGVRLAFTLDEGMGIVQRGLVPGLDGDVALVGIAEKGYVSLELAATARRRPLLDAPARDRRRPARTRAHPRRREPAARGDSRTGGGDVRRARAPRLLPHPPRAPQPLALRPCDPRGAPRASRRRPRSSTRPPRRPCCAPA